MPEPVSHDLDFSSLPEPELPGVDKPYSIVIAGVGGTGVTTLGAILGMAAHLEDKGASVLDMTGLAQKFGAVITHLQVSSDAEQIHAARIAAGGAKLVLGCDLVVAASNDAMVKVDRNVASAVINSHEAMTAEFTRDPDARFPADSMHGIITECVGEAKTHFINAVEAAEQLLGDSMPANILMAGFAYQKGYIPVSAEAICSAIELNGAAVKQNLEAFNLGRLLAHKPDALQVEPREEWKPLTDLEEIINDRKRFLTGYQDFDYAERYEALVRDVQAAERKVSSGDALTKAAARSYFKLLAYKDEYEVARLYTEGSFEKRIREQFSGDFRIKFHLAPPLIARKDKNTGLPRKMTFGPWTLSLFRQLARFRFVRGTRLDPFSYTADRKLERQLIAEYEQLVEQLLPRLDEDNIDTIEQLLDLPEKIRGYGYIKRRNADAAEQEKKALLAKLDARPEPVRFVDPKAA